MRKLASINKFSGKNGVLRERMSNRGVYREEKDFIEDNKNKIRIPKDRQKKEQVEKTE